MSMIKMVTKYGLTHQSSKSILKPIYGATKMGINQFMGNKEREGMTKEERLQDALKRNDYYELAKITMEERCEN